MEPVCPVCHVAVRPTDFYCYNCGKNLHEKPLTPMMEYAYYAGSVLLPPLGIFWGLRFVNTGDTRMKRIGWICIVLTVISTLIAAVWSVQIYRNIDAQVNQQLQGIPGM